MGKMLGLDTLKKKLSAMPEAAKRRLSQAIDTGADEIVAMQKRLAPKKSGALAASIKKVKGDYKPANANVRGVGFAKGGSDVAVAIVAGDERAFYAAFVEHGTNMHRIAPKEGSLAIGGRVLPEGQAVTHPGAEAQPFFYPAYRALKGRVKRRISRETRRALKGVANGGA